jgi:hypothetical protein
MHPSFGTVYGKIDRDKIVSQVIEINNYKDEIESKKGLYNLYVSICLSLGISRFEEYCGSRPV